MKFLFTFIVIIDRKSSEPVLLQAEGLTATNALIDALTLNEKSNEVFYRSTISTVQCSELVNYLSRKSSNREENFVLVNDCVNIWRFTWLLDPDQDFVTIVAVNTNLDCR